MTFLRLKSTGLPFTSTVLPGHLVHFLRQEARIPHECQGLCSSCAHSLLPARRMRGCTAHGGPAGSLALTPGPRGRAPVRVRSLILSHHAVDPWEGPWLSHGKWPFLVSFPQPWPGHRCTQHQACGCLNENSLRGEDQCTHGRTRTGVLVWFAVVHERQRLALGARQRPAAMTGRGHWMPPHLRIRSHPAGQHCLWGKQAGPAAPAASLRRGTRSAAELAWQGCTT